MNDPAIHSSNWEWENTYPSSRWKHSHNYVHHKFTNIVGLDSDVGYGILRMTRDQKWSPVYLAQPFYNVLPALLFEWGGALHHLDVESIRRGDYDRSETLRNAKEVGRKIARQVGKDYVVFPALTGPAWKNTLTANITVNVIRNLWAYGLIFGHFPDGAEKFTKEEFDQETKVGVRCWARRTSMQAPCSRS